MDQKGLLPSPVTVIKAKCKEKGTFLHVLELRQTRTNQLKGSCTEERPSNLSDCLYSPSSLVYRACRETRCLPCRLVVVTAPINAPWTDNDCLWSWISVMIGGQRTQPETANEPMEAVEPCDGDSAAGHRLAGSEERSIGVFCLSLC